VGAGELSAGELSEPPITFCEERQLLLERVGEAVSQIISLQSERIAAVARGEMDLSSLDGAIRDATAEKESRKQAFMAHVWEHGC